MSIGSPGTKSLYTVIPLLFSMVLSAIGGIVYELIIAGISSYLLGNSIYQFSIIIGLYLFAMGVGAYGSRYLHAYLIEAFMVVEIAIALVGGSCALLLFAAYAFTPLYQPLTYVVTLSIGFLVGFEIPVLTRIIEEKHRNLRTTLANVLSFDYVGSLVGSIAFPLVLFPYLGFIRTAFLIGLINLTVVLIILLRFRRELRFSAAFIIAALLCAALLITGFANSDPISFYLEQQLYNDKVIYVKATPYQKIVLTRYRDDVRLFLNGNLQFSSKDEYRYHEALVHPAMSLAPNRESVLILGGGDGLAAREVLKYGDVTQITLVDLDPAMTRLGQQHPALVKLNRGSLNSPKIRIINDDAHKFLEESSDLYQVIVIDLPDPNTEALSKLYTVQFYRLVKRHLSADGVMVTQSTSPFFAPKAFWSIVKSVSEAGLYTMPYHVNVPSFGDWGFTLAADWKIGPPDLRLNPQLHTQFLNQEIAAAMTEFGDDVLRYKDRVEANTISNPVLLGYYEESYKSW